MRLLRRNRFALKRRYATEKKGERLEQCLGGLLKCVSVLCCNKAGGKDLKNTGEMKDFASNLVRVCVNDISTIYVIVPGHLTFLTPSHTRWNLPTMIRKWVLCSQICMLVAKC